MIVASRSTAASFAAVAISSVTEALNSVTTSPSVAILVRSHGVLKEVSGGHAGTRPAGDSTDCQIGSRRALTKHKSCNGVVAKHWQ